jgi:hypothetical protein
MNNPRSARRQFLPAGFWIMVKDTEMRNFIDTVCEEEQQLEGDDEEDDDMGDEPIPEEQLRVMPAWPRARRFLSKRQMAKISPRLGLLNNLPMTLPFGSRVKIMGGFIRYAKAVCAHRWSTSDTHLPLLQKRSPQIDALYETSTLSSHCHNSSNASQHRLLQRIQQTRSCAQGKHPDCVSR